MFLKGQEVPVKNHDTAALSDFKKEKRKKNQQTVTYLLYILKTFKGFKDKLH